MLTLPNYQIGSQIYESLNSLVYRGHRNKDNQPVILKMLKQDYPTSAELTRYRQEYEITHDLDLAGVIKAYSVEKYQNTLVIILEDFGGESLKQLMANRPFLLKEFLPVAIQIADSLGNIHAANLIHKDINPSNIVVNIETKLLKIIDFGIASRLPRENPTLKNPEQLEGTLAYLSPEQTGRINRSMDYRTDLYSLGVTFYELLIGQLPFTATDAMELVHCHIAKKPVEVNKVNSNVPPIVSDIVKKLMAKNAEDRYQSAFGLKADLEECLTLTKKVFGNKLFSTHFELAQNDFSGKFEIPQKLYGRNLEIKTLLQAFERTSQGSAEMMLVAGYSGVGKTALVHEVHKPMTEKRGYFAAGKFDQFQKNVPYSAITQAFNEFCRYLLMENAETLANWQTKILDAVGNNGQIIIDVVPDLELVIGPQPAVASVGPTEAQNRFQIFFLNFIKVLSEKEHPLILFIDDLQWVDSASLGLLKSIMLDDEIQHLLIIGAYRDNEVDGSHPFIMAVSELQRANVNINSIELANLQQEDVNQLLQDSLSCETALTQPLTDLVYQKTQGNAFFTHQFLQTLYSDALLHFDFEQLKWQWDVEQIAAQNITANVVELMVNQINKLPSSTSAALQLAACIGNQFDLPILAIIYEQDKNETLSVLHQAITEGLIQPLDGNYKHFDTFEKAKFKFLHDRVQQAAYSLIDDKQKQAIHLSVGRLLLANMPEPEDELFEVVDHLNIGQELIEDDQEKIQLTQLNLAAGKKAKNGAAYVAAQAYLRAGMKNWSENAWTKHYQLNFVLCRELAEVEYLNGHFEQSEALIELLLNHAKTNIEKAEVYNLLIVQYTMIAKYEEAIQTGRKALAILGIDLPENDLPQALEVEMTQAASHLQDQEISSLLNKPEMTQPEKQVALKLLMNIDPPAYYCNQALYPVIVAKSVNLSLKYGNIAESSKGYATYGILRGSISGDYQAGYEFGWLAVKLSEKFNDMSQKCKSCLILGNFLNAWVKPIKSAEFINNEGYQAGLESGDLQFAGYILMHKVINSFMQGKQVGNILEQLPDALRFSHQSKNDSVTDALLTYQLSLFNLAGITASPLIFSSNNLDEAQYLEQCHSNQSFHALCLYYILKAQIFYLYGQMADAHQYALKATKFLNFLFSLAPTAEHHFYESLILASLYPNTTTDKQQEYWQQLKTYQKQMKVWADNCPENFLHKYLLVEAEMAGLSSDIVKAMALYDRAIASARENEFIQIEALANELAAKFWLANGKEEFAQGYLTKAYYCYQQWGALAKVTNLEAKYPQLVTASKILISDVTTTGTVISTNATRLQTSTVLDLDSITKAAQTLTSEIVLDKLLEKMMHIVIENAGAERGFLLLPQGEQWVIEAEGAINKPEITTLHSLPAANHLPEAIISYVAHTQENVRLDDATQAGIYTDNPYIKTHQTQSVLCFPIIYQQQLRAILYFENNLTTGAFTPQRLKVLTMLSSQIAISLENAQVMAHLDTKVKDRTAQLNAKVEELTQTRHELVQSEKMASLGRLVAGFAHELNTPLGVAIGSASLLRRKAKKVNSLVEQEEVDVDELLAILKSIDKGSDLTLSNLERAANLVTSFKRTAIDQTSDKVRSFHIHQVVNDTINTLQSQFKKTAIQISVDCPKALKVKSLPGALEQILTNLLMNSFIHGFNDGQNAGVIQINVQLSGEQLHLEYSDNGKGIASDNLEKIFEPFFTTHRAHGGSGLGMYICYNVITTQLHGTLSCESTLGIGVVFKIDYPIEAQ